MNAIRRTAVLLGLVAAVVVGTGIPASATFAASSPAVAAAKVTTGSVTAPATVNVSKSCTQYAINVTVTWTAGTATKGVTGYRVMAHPNNGSAVSMGETGPSTLTLSGQAPLSYLAMQPRLSVMTLTGTTWTASTAQTAVLSC